MKLKKDFFKRHDIRIIEEMPNGKDYILLYLKLLVESVSHEGHLRFSDTIPYNEQMIATITHTNIDIVRSAMKIFESLHMVDVLDDETIYMTEVKNMVGSETEWARKKRIYRQNQPQIEDKQRTLKGQCLKKEDNVRQEIEKELDIDKEIYKDIVEHLNEKAGTNYKHTSKITQKHINGRLSEGYTLEDFKAVIDKKVTEWAGTVMAKYLRPETLFGTKFEGYLNQKSDQKSSNNKFNQFPQRKYSAQDYADIEKKLINKGL